MKIAFITDTHLGARNSSSIFRNLFREYYRDVFFPYLEEHSIQTVLHLGDFFDSRNSVTLHDIDYVMNEFIPLVESWGGSMIIIAGNHDVAFRNTNKINSLALLRKCDNITIVHDKLEVVKTQSKQFVMCPWINSENQDELFDGLAYYANDAHILCGHLDIVGALMYKNSKPCDHGFEPSKFSKFHKVLSGHFHHASVYGNIEYVGALFHYNWQDCGDWRGFRVYDDETNSFELIENPYSLFTELTYSDELLQTSKEDLATLCAGQFVRITINQEYDKVDLKTLINAIEKTSPIKVDVIDNTITEQPEVDLDGTVSVQVKEIHEYVEESLAENPKKETISNLFELVYNEAKDNMRTVE